MNYHVVDITIFVIANFVNLALATIFLARARGNQEAAKILSASVLITGIPLTIAIVINASGQREWWTVVFPALLLAHFLMELVLDTILKLDFRSTRLLWPYLAVYYLALFAMIGYSSGKGKVFGFITLATYFVNLPATGYSYARVGHGQSEERVIV
jgi:hypothetical protein